MSIPQYTPELAKAIRAAIEHRHDPADDPTSYEHFFVQCLSQRYLRREWSWATLLDSLGKHCDPGGPIDCEIPFGLLNKYEESNFDQDLEAIQFRELSDQLDLHSTEFAFLTMLRHLDQGN